MISSPVQPSTDVRGLPKIVAPPSDDGEMMSSGEMFLSFFFRFLYFFSAHIDIALIASEFEAKTPTEDR